MSQCVDHGTTFPDTRSKIHEILASTDQKLLFEAGFNPKRRTFEKKKSVSQPMYIFPLGENDTLEYADVFILYIYIYIYM